MQGRTRDKCSWLELKLKVANKELALNKRSLKRSLKESPERLLENKGALVTSRLCYSEDALLLDLVENWINFFNLSSG